METEKIIGNVLLGVGLILIIISFYSMYDVFMGTAKPPLVLKMESIAISPPSVSGAETPPTKIEVVSGSELSKIINIALWYVFMFFVLSAGTKIAGLGVKLIKE